MTTNANDNSEFEDPLENYDPVEYSSRLEKSLAEETVTAMKIQPCATLSPLAPIRDAIRLLRTNAIASILIVDGKKLVGIFTERDVLENVALSYSEMLDQPVSEAMSTEPFVVYGSDPTGLAVAAIAVAGYRHVPVVDTDFHLLGVVSPQRVFDFMTARMS